MLLKTEEARHVAESYRVGEGIFSYLPPKQFHQGKTYQRQPTYRTRLEPSFVVKLLQWRTRAVAEKPESIFYHTNMNYHEVS